MQLESDFSYTCEKWQCSWIRQPFNAWSSLIFLAVGLMLVFEAKAETTLKVNPSRHRKLAIAGFLFLIGLSSFMSHASEIWFFGYFDFMFQIGFLGFIAAIRCRTRWGKSLLFFEIAAATLCLMISWRVSSPILYFFAAQAIVLELYSWRFARPFADSEKNHKYLFMGVGVCLIGLPLFALDRSGTICAPQNHLLQLHGLWHICAALGIYLLAQYFAREIEPCRRSI